MRDKWRVKGGQWREKEGDSEGKRGRVEEGGGEEGNQWYGSMIDSEVEIDTRVHDSVYHLHNTHSEHIYLGKSTDKRRRRRRRRVQWCETTPSSLSASEPETCQQLPSGKSSLSVCLVAGILVGNSFPSSFGLEHSNV